MTAACSTCGETKSLDAFHKNSSRKNGRTSRRKDCTNAKWRQDGRRDSYYLRKYGIPAAIAYLRTNW